MTSPAIVVSISSLPSRIEHIKPTIDSLFSQSVEPDRLLICLPYRSKREGTDYLVPEWIGQYGPRVEVVRCATDYGPATKLLAALPLVPSADYLVVADDDMRYPFFFLETISRQLAKNPSAAFSFSVYSVGPLVIGEGAFGFGFARSLLAGIESFSDMVLRHRPLLLHDDLWISAFLYSKGVPVLPVDWHPLRSEDVVASTHHEIAQLRHLDGADGRSAVLREGYSRLARLGVLGRKERIKALTKIALRAMGLPSGW